MKKHMYAEFKPKDDITTTELAKCIETVLSELTLTFDNELIKNLPQNCKRHFQVNSRGESKD